MDAGIIRRVSIPPVWEEAMVGRPSFPGGPAMSTVQNDA